MLFWRAPTCVPFCLGGADGTRGRLRDRSFCPGRGDRPSPTRDRFAARPARSHWNCRVSGWSPCRHRTSPQVRAPFGHSPDAPIPCPARAGWFMTGWKCGRVARTARGHSPAHQRAAGRAALPGPQDCSYLERDLRRDLPVPPPGLLIGLAQGTLAHDPGGGGVCPLGAAKSCTSARRVQSHGGRARPRQDYCWHCPAAVRRHIALAIQAAPDGG